MGIKILVADDSITIQKVIGIIFGGDEYSLVIVDNGKAAVEKALEIVPDIFLIDVLMPGMNGYEVCEAIRAMAAVADKPILFLTGSFEPFDEERALKCGADDFIAKPFESKQIIHKVTELLERGQQRAASLQTAVPEQTEEQPVSFFPFDLVTPVAIPVQEPPQIPEPLAAPTDIWSAFISETVEEEQPPSLPVSPASLIPEELIIEPDLFVVISEEYDAHLVTENSVTEASPADETTQWQSVDVNTCDFSPTYVRDEPAPVPSGTSPLTFDIPAMYPPLSEEQLRAAITAASKDVIERIVREVVPDLAEAMIREAIRTITESR